MYSFEESCSNGSYPLKGRIKVTKADGTLLFPDLVSIGQSSLQIISHPI